VALLNNGDGAAAGAAAGFAICFRRFGGGGIGASIGTNVWHSCASCLLTSNACLLALILRISCGLKLKKICT